MVSPNVSAKAARLAGIGAVTPRRGHTYSVQGDHDIYTTVVLDASGVVGVCSCPAEKVCSHLIAACAYEVEHPITDEPLADPFAGLPE